MGVMCICAALPGREDDIANYTLMSCKMNSRYPVDEMRALSLAPPFRFTKGLQVLRIPAQEKYKGLNQFGHLLFDLQTIRSSYIRFMMM